MSNAEIEYFNRKYRSLKTLQKEFGGNPRNDMVGWWFSKAQTVKNIMHDLGYEWINNEFVSIRTQEEDE